MPRSSIGGAARAWRSRTSPTEMAVGLAEQLNVTVCGYVRGEGLNLYAGSGLLLDEEVAAARG